MVLGLTVGKAETPPVSGMKCKVDVSFRPVDGGEECCQSFMCIPF